MVKSSEAFRTIGEMASELGVKTHILRYWEEQFPMLQPLKRAGGRRHYRPDDVLLLREIHRLLNGEGYTIKGARNHLSNDGADRADVPSSPSQTDKSLVPVAALIAIRQRLSDALAAA